jgi:hypothetical protein
LAGALANPRDAILAVPLANFLDGIFLCDLGNFLEGIFCLAFENFLEGIFAIEPTWGEPISLCQNAVGRLNACGVAFDPRRWLRLVRCVLRQHQCQNGRNVLHVAGAITLVIGIGQSREHGDLSRDNASHARILADSVRMSISSFVGEFCLLGLAGSFSNRSTTTNHTFQMTGKAAVAVYGSAVENHELEE